MIRVISDLHYGDRACRLRSLHELDPLFDGVDQLVVNGDAVDTRTGPYPERTGLLRREVTAYFAEKRAVLMTGNHDPDISSLHWQTLANRKVLVVHGDMLFDTITPWGKDASEIRTLIAAGRARKKPTTFDEECAVFRDVAARLRQRHQVETNFWRYIVSFTSDTFWPPTRSFAILKAWRDTPELAAALARRFQPEARCILLGHLHRPGIWRTQDGRTIINTGSFCTGFDAWAVDITDDQVVAWRLKRTGGKYHPAEIAGRVPIGA